MWEACTEAVARARAGEGPSFVECVTMRMDGHAIHDDASYVPPEVFVHWRQRDPIELAEAALRAQGWSDADGVALRAEIAEELKAALAQSPSPSPSPRRPTSSAASTPSADLRPADQLDLGHQA